MNKVADGTPGANTDQAGFAHNTVRVTYNTVEVDGLNVFYREAGPENAPTIILLHGFPTSSHMFRNLIPRLADAYHVVAPDYPGFGHSSMPEMNEWDYSFANIAGVVDSFTQKLGLSSYTLYVQDYGAPVGYRLALTHPERVQGLIVQNGNAYEEGLGQFWDPLKAYWQDPTTANGDKLRASFELSAVRWQYTHGVRKVNNVSPDNWTLDQALLDRPGNKDVQLALYLDYSTNVLLYPRFQAYFRQHQPPTLLVWGRNDQIFLVQGAESYKRDLEDLEYQLLDTGHFALEEEGGTIAVLIRDFMVRKVTAAR